MEEGEREREYEDKKQQTNQTSTAFSEKKKRIYPQSHFFAAQCVCAYCEYWDGLFFYVLYVFSFFFSLPPPT